MIIKIIVSKFLTHTLTMKNLQTQNQLFTLQRNIDEVIEDFTISFNSIKTQKRYKTVLKQFFELLKVQKLEQLADVPLVEVKRVFDCFRKSKSHYDEQNTTHLGSVRNSVSV